tara:strand:- start:36777 stop:37067 length:291 start_codon:yes stop_codon:yes gene_type:complete
MKKVILSALVVVLMVVASCKNETKKEQEEVKTEEVNEIADNTLYQCPMDCEKGKSYTEAGNCPVCNMALKAKKVDMDADANHEGHDGEDHGNEESN